MNTPADDQKETIPVGAIAAKELSETSDARAVEPLIVAKKESKMSVNTLASIERLKIERNIKALEAALCNKKEESEIRQKIAEALGEIGGPLAIRSLVVGFTTTDRKVYLAIIRALIACDDSAKVVSDLISDPDKKVRENAIDAGVHMGAYKAKNRKIFPEFDQLSEPVHQAPAGDKPLQKNLSIKDLIVQRRLRPLGNKKRLVFDQNKGCLDYRAQFRDKASAERYFEAFVRYAGQNPPPTLIEVMAAYTPETIYSEKYAFILPYFDYGSYVRKDYQKWAREAILHCNDLQRQHSYSAGYDYSYLPKSISSNGAVIKWAILPPQGFDPGSPEAQEWLIDPPGMGYDAVNLEGGGSAVPNKPEPQGPWIGVLFDISKFEEAWYGRAATKLLLEMIGEKKLSGCVIHGGDLLPDGRYWCNAIHAASQEQAGWIETCVVSSKNAKLAQDRPPVIRGQQVPVSTLPFQGFVSREGVYVGN